MAKTLKELKEQDFQIETCGTNSIILKRADYAYKITREYSTVQATEIMKEINTLEAYNIAIPKAFGVDEVAFSSPSDFNNAISMVMSSDGKIDWKKIAPIVNNTIGESAYILPMLKYQFVYGESLFSDKRLGGLNLINRNECFRNCEKLHPQIKEMLEKDLVPNLALFEEMDSQIMYKFLTDGELILRTGITIDNHTCENFIYGVADGVKAIYYIDIGGLERMATHKEFGERNLFGFTIDNMCRMIYINTTADLGELKTRQRGVFNKISDTLKTFLDNNPNCLQQFDEYMQRDNYFKKLKMSLNTGSPENQVQPN